ncbi:hypothetical protein FSP39_006255 [Pinctada imbricata]|uniref:Uncharacterized protein n=1 Tax=Pinctada imbricata TaxID=66713 RepID=A0AA89C0M9_PINIB|nr:hypothetical protein FSP39_006255 [Pinctada imbricata]
MSRRLSNQTRSDATTPGQRRPRGSIANARFATTGKSDKRGDLTDTTGLLEITSLGTDPSDNNATRRGMRMENTYKLEPDDDRVFRVGTVEKTTENILAEHLKDETYDPLRCRELSQKLASTILERVKVMGYKRYKIITNVSIGSLKEKPGMQFGSRCLWNKNTDNFVSVKYSNNSIFAVAMIYGLYFE